MKLQGQTDNTLYDAKHYIFFIVNLNKQNKIV